MWGGHVFIRVFHRGLCAEGRMGGKKKKKNESEGKYQVTCVTERCFCNS